MKNLISACVVILSGLLLFSCDGGTGSSGTCAPSVTITQGTWCITIQESAVNFCDRQTTISPPYTADLTQNENSLSAVSQGETYTGSICGNEGTMYGSTSITKITFSDADHGTGSTDWNTGSCSGTDTFIAVSGGC